MVLRRYNSFIIRRWQLSEGKERVEVEHMQTGERATVEDLAAARWMEVVGDEAGGAHRRQDTN